MGIKVQNPPAALGGSDLMSRFGGQLGNVQGATSFKPGAIIIDWFDPVIFDDVNRSQFLFNRIDKRLAPGDHTGGFDETAIGDARVANREDLQFLPVNPTRVARTPREIKAIVKDIRFGIFYQSVGQLPTQPFGDLTQKDVSDQKSSCMRLWANLAYEGSISADPLEFDGLRTLLGPGTTIQDSESIVRQLNSILTSMTNDPDHLVMPTAIYTNGIILQRIAEEQLKMGQTVSPSMNIKIGDYAYQVNVMPTTAGLLPIIADPFNQPIAGTPQIYPTFIITERLLSWQYVPVLGRESAEPQTFEIALNNTLDRDYKTVMFGALELIGGTTHHRRINIEDRTTTISPSA